MRTPQQLSTIGRSRLEGNIIFQSFSIHLDTSQKPGGGGERRVSNGGNLDRGSRGRVSNGREERHFQHALASASHLLGNYLVPEQNYQLSNIARIKRATAGTSAISCMRQSTIEVVWCPRGYCARHQSRDTRQSPNARTEQKIDANAKDVQGTSKECFLGCVNMG